MKRFWQEISNEYSKITWPTKNEAKGATVLAIALTAAVSIYTGIFDGLFSWVLNLIIG